MFTGLIKDIGIIKSIRVNTEGKIFEIEAPKLISDIKIDDSVATNGVCLTATKVTETSFFTQAVHVTLEKTTLGLLKEKSRVNLELAMRPMDRLGGHFVQGHVNTTAKIVGKTKRGENYLFKFKIKEEFFKYLISEGSIAINGISLTLSEVNPPFFCVSIIPHSYENTILHLNNIGDLVNIEVDMIAKYVENLLAVKVKK